MTEIEICNRLLRLLGGPEAVEMFLASPQPLLGGWVPQAMLDAGLHADLAFMVDMLRTRVG